MVKADVPYQETSTFFFLISKKPQLENFVLHTLEIKIYCLRWQETGFGATSLSTSLSSINFSLFCSFREYLIQVVYYTWLLHYQNF